MASSTAPRPKGTGSVWEDKVRGRWVGTYEAGWTARGTRRRRKVYAKTERLVKAKLIAAMRAEQVADDAATTRPTVKRWAEQWLDLKRDRHRPSTWATNRSAITKWVVPTIGHKRLDRLTPGDIRAVMTAILAAGGAPASARRAQAVLEKMLRDARTEGHTVPERVLDVEGPEAAETDRDAIPIPDALALLAAAADDRLASRWVAAFLQGMRQAECLGLTWDCVDLDERTIDVSWQLKALPYNVPRDRSSGFRVPVGFTAKPVRGALHLVRPKTARGRRVIPIVPWFADALTRWRDDETARLAELGRDWPSHGLVWPREDGNPRTDHDDRADWYALQDRAQVACVDGEAGRRYLLHEGRHTTATLLRMGGASDETITAVMGHASILSTKAYLHVNNRATREAMGKVAASLGLVAQQIEGPTS